MKSLAIVLAGLRLCAQTPAAAEFEVASIKPNKSASGGVSIHHSDGLWRATNISVKTLLQNAYDVLPEQVQGAPTWIESERFDIEAKFEVNPGGDKGNVNAQRLQALLASRFQLRVHRQTKEWQAYALVVAKNGHKLTPAKEERDSMRSTNGHMEFKGVDLENLARNLAGRLGRPVSNQTGIDGKFDFVLDFEPEGQARPPDKDNPAPGADSRKPSLFTAVQDQLGLKLESRKAPVEMLVIDRVDRPTDN